MSEKVKTRKPREKTYAELEAEVARLKTTIETRGVNSRGTQPRTGLNLGDIYENVSWRDIRNMKNREVN